MRYLLFFGGGFVVFWLILGSSYLVWVYFLFDYVAVWTGLVVIGCGLAVERVCIVNVCLVFAVIGW